MMPRRLPLDPRSVPLHRALPAVAPAPVAWPRKATALAMHLSGLTLFALTVVWPVVSPIASGELGREFRPMLHALVAWAMR